MNSFNKNIIDIYGNKGKGWLSALPELTAELANKFQLTDLQPVKNMNFSYVAYGLQNEKAIILKLGLNERALAKEATCLQAFAHHGAAEVIATEPGMILMRYTLLRFWLIGYISVVSIYFSNNSSTQINSVHAMLSMIICFKFFKVNRNFCIGICSL